MHDVSHSMRHSSPSSTGTALATHVLVTLGSSSPLAHMHHQPLAHIHTHTGPAAHVLVTLGSSCPLPSMYSVKDCSTVCTTLRRDT